MTTVMNLGMDKMGMFRAQLSVQNKGVVQLEGICVNSETDLARGAQGLTISQLTINKDYTHIIVNSTGYDTHRPVSDEVAHIVGRSLVPIFKAVEVVGTYNPQGGYKQ